MAHFIPSTFGQSAVLLLRLPAVALDARVVLHRNNVHIIGQGKPPLLLSNGFGCSQHIWRYLLPGLAKHYQLVLFDHIGSGEADPAACDAQKYNTLAGYAQDVVEICKVLNLRDVIIMGHSVGATIAVLAALAVPMRFSKLILLAASPCYLNEPGYYGGFERVEILQALALMENDYHGWANVFASMLTGQQNYASIGEELVENFCAMKMPIAKQLARVTFFADNRKDFA